MNALSPFGWAYAAGAGLRNALYDRGWLAAHDLGAPAISIGNITAGGTGKTPIVALVAGMLIESGERVCILTRGYGRRDPAKRVVVADGSAILADAETGGDEPVELARRLGGKVVIIADADRVAAAKFARDNFGVTCFVLDDGFQHRRAARNLDIVCIDATDPFGGGELLPAGRLRESPANLCRADAIIITKAEAAVDLTKLGQEIRRFAPEAAIFRAESGVSGFTELAAFLAREADQTNRNLPGPAFAFCGLGNPKHFFKTLDEAGVEIAGTKAFRDHQRYTQADAERLDQAAKDAEAAAFVTTAKDAVKLQGLTFGLPCFVGELAVRVMPADAFRELIMAAGRKNH
ncbi:MAG TPA: tetraacyldisaccharide 4'-kinase [Blastocatellia bacterium]|nr:tetraacyldisaccharide 4'-kinase [Blastocatellia bacterium]